MINKKRIISLTLIVAMISNIPFTSFAMENTPVFPVNIAISGDTAKKTTDTNQKILFLTDTSKTQKDSLLLIDQDVLKTESATNGYLEQLDQSYEFLLDSYKEELLSNNASLNQMLNDMDLMISEADEVIDVVESQSRKMLLDPSLDEEEQDSIVRCIWDGNIYTNGKFNEDIFGVPGYQTPYQSPIAQYVDGKPVLNAQTLDTYAYRGHRYSTSFANMLCTHTQTYHGDGTGYTHVNAFVKGGRAIPNVYDTLTIQTTAWGRGEWYNLYTFIRVYDKNGNLIDDPNITVSIDDGYTGAIRLKTTTGEGAIAAGTDGNYGGPPNNNKPILWTVNLSSLNDTCYEYFLEIGFHSSAYMWSNSQYMRFDSIYFSNANDYNTMTYEQWKQNKR